MKTANYEIKWSYNHIYNLVEQPKKMDQARELDHIDTVCFIMKGNVSIDFGLASCGKNDNFCRDKGRKLSLARALKSALIPKEERTEIWECYRNMKKGGRW